MDGKIARNAIKLFLMTFDNRLSFPLHNAADPDENVVFAFFLRSSLSKRAAHIQRQCFGSGFTESGSGSGSSILG
jgi:hypothetical protein